MNVISSQSQVAYGHVGNSAAVFPMQMHGIDVTAVPTTRLSNRPGYPTIRGWVLDAQLVADLLLGIEERGAVDTAPMILSGYLGSPDVAAVVADFVARAKARNPELALLLRPRARGSLLPFLGTYGEEADGDRNGLAATAGGRLQ
jgi:pyridoxine kinase